jgi:hypothetical protein
LPYRASSGLEYFQISGLRHIDRACDLMRR